MGVRIYVLEVASPLERVGLRVENSGSLLPLICMQRRPESFGLPETPGIVLVAKCLCSLYNGNSLIRTPTVKSFPNYLTNYGRLT